MIKAERQITKSRKADPKADAVLEKLDRFQIEQGLAPVGEAARAKALGGKPELAAADRRMVEEVAAIRLVLRNTFALAQEAQEARNYIRLAEVFSIGCVRLVRMLREEGGDPDRLMAYLSEQIDQALDMVIEELGVSV